MIKKPLVTFSELRKTEPELYETMSEIVRMISENLYKQNPGIQNQGLEGLIEIVEKLIEQGKLRVATNGNIFWIEKYNFDKEKYEKLKT